MSKQIQGGYVLLALMLVLFVSGSSFLIGALNTRQAGALVSNQELALQLAQAKESLLNYAAYTYISHQGQLGPGYLPCPDMDNDGWPQALVGTQDQADTQCPSGMTLGRLPEKIMTPTGLYSFNEYYSGIDQQFWYAVSSRHLRTNTNTPASQKTDPSLARLRLDGAGGVVALVFAPGEALPGQSRTSGTGQLEAENYLDGGNGSAITSFVSMDSANPAAFNDRVVGITHNELMQAVGLNAAIRFKSKLDAYHDANNVYPTDSFTFLLFGIFPVTSFCVPVAFFNTLDEPWMSSEGWTASANCTGSASHRSLQFITYRRLSTDSATIRFGNCAIAYTLTHDAGIETLGTSTTC